MQSAQIRRQREAGQNDTMNPGPEALYSLVLAPSLVSADRLSSWPRGKSVSCLPPKIRSNLVPHFRIRKAVGLTKTCTSKPKAPTRPQYTRVRLLQKESEREEAHSGPLHSLGTQPTDQSHFATSALWILVLHSTMVQ